MMIHADKITLRDGAISLYLRPTVKRPIWQGRIKLPREPAVRVSTCLTDFEEARVWAEDQYEQLRFKQTKGLTIRSKDTAVVCDEFLA